MSTKKLDLVEREKSGGVVIDVVGELTVASGTESLLEKVRSNVAAGRRTVVINLAKVTRVDSSGLGELVTCLVTATRHDGVVRLSNVPQQIRGLMKMTNILKAFELFDTEDAALAASATS
ncbi:MAG TPA: STAS domain-containing protein [Pyrinomonadaceae bacterium]|nr:STAS domain-containing protein [Pyrinomonadaceae bacterium]